MLVTLWHFRKTYPMHTAHTVHTHSSAELTVSFTMLICFGNKNFKSPFPTPFFSSSIFNSLHIPKRISSLTIPMRLLQFLRVSDFIRHFFCQIRVCTIFRDHRHYRQIFLSLLLAADCSATIAQRVGSDTSAVAAATGSSSAARHVRCTMPVAARHWTVAAGRRRRIGERRSSSVRRLGRLHALKQSQSVRPSSNTVVASFFFSSNGNVILTRTIFAP